MNQFEAYFQANKELWNNKTQIHKDSEFYDLPAFLAGKSSLTPIETSELGDLKGKKILHLQCHFGMDSLSMARAGARLTGVDFSDAAIEEAGRLNEQLGLDAKFICCNVYDLDQYLNDTFDIVFTSYGVIGWLPDLNAWAKLIYKYVKPGGFFYMAEFHPVVWMMDEDFKEIKYYYQNKELITVQLQGTYADRDASINGMEYSWNHGLGEVLNALLTKGFQLQFLNEFTYSPYSCFNNLVKGDDGNYRIKGLEDKIPMVYSIKMLKPA